MNLFGEAEENAPAISAKPCEELSKRELLRMEKEVTGLYLSGHPMKNYEKYVKRSKTTQIAEIANGGFSDGDRVTVVALLSSLKVKTTKGNTQIAGVVLEDMTGTIEAIAFGKIFLQYRPLFAEDSIVKITGRISERDDRPAELICESLSAVTEADVAAAEKAVPEKLYIRADSAENTLLGDIKRVLISLSDGGESGVIPVYIFAADTRKTLIAPREMWLAKSADFSAVTEKLENIVGKGNAKYTY